LSTKIEMSARVFRPRLRDAVAVAAVFACGTLSACSPYVFSNDVQTLSTKMASIDASYQDSARKIVAEQHLSRRIEWIRKKPRLAISPGCDVKTHGTSPVRCDLNEEGAPSVVTTADTVVDPPVPAPAVAVCEPATDLPSAPTAEA
jgi:hypothetical protein